MAIKDPFARNMVLGSLAFAGVLVVMFTVLTTVYLHLRPKCSDEVVSESMGPDRHWIATTMQCRCAESPFLTHVNLRDTNSSIQYGFFSGRAEQGEVFQLEREAQAAHLAIIWDSPSQLTIRCFDCTDASKRLERWENVAIRYELNGR
jgi:hypothetical protein